MKSIKPFNPLWLLILIPVNLTPLLVSINYLLMSMKQRGITLLVVVLAAPGLEFIISSSLGTLWSNWVANAVWYGFSLVLILVQRNDYLKITQSQYFNGEERN